MKLERTKNSMRNIIWGVLNKMVILVFPFILRTIFIYTIGVDYLGLNSLFTSILTVLNLAELGFSSAIVYNMYQPIAENDTATICALMKCFKKVYYIIGGVVLISGLMVIPFLNWLIMGDYPKGVNLSILYLLFLGNTVVSYFLFSYKNCILIAYQREDIISKINIVLRMVLYIAQALSLIVLESYYLYVVLMILNTITTNVVTAFYSNKHFPQYKCKGEISQKSKVTLKKNIKGLVIGKVCLVSRNSFDSIFLSAFLGLKTVTIYSNYYYIMNAISGILIILMTSIGAGIGNSVATESVEKNFNDFKKFTFMYAWISSWCTVCLFCLYQPFMTIWMGKGMLFPMVDVFLLCIYFYSLTMGDVRSQYSTATGLFWENRVYVLAEAVVNISLNAILGKLMGVHGIILATWISIFFINFCWGSTIIFKYYFKDYSLLKYYGCHVKYIVAVILTTGITYYVSGMISLDLLAGFGLKILICIFLPNILFFCMYFKDKEFSESITFIKKVYHRK